MSAHLFELFNVNVCVCFSSSFALNYQPSLFTQVVERLLSLPADYWSQFVMVENEQPNTNHLIIENANSYATPERSMSSPDIACYLAVYAQVWAQLFAGVSL